MPIVHVKARELRNPQLAEQGLSAIAGAVARAIGSNPDSVWCTFTPVETETIGLKWPEWNDRILYLDLLMKDRGQDVGEQALEAAARAAADAFEVRLENVWSRLIELGSRKVFAGGRFV